MTETRMDWFCVVRNDEFPSMPGLVQLESLSWARPISNERRKSLQWWQTSQKPRFSMVFQRVPPTPVESWIETVRYVSLRASGEVIAEKTRCKKLVGLVAGQPRREREDYAEVCRRET